MSSTRLVPLDDTKYTCTTVNTHTNYADMWVTWGIVTLIGLLAGLLAMIMLQVQPEAGFIAGAVTVATILAVIYAAVITRHNTLIEHSNRLVAPAALNEPIYDTPNVDARRRRTQDSKLSTISVEKKRFRDGDLGVQTPSIERHATAQLGVSSSPLIPEEHAYRHRIGEIVKSALGHVEVIARRFDNDTEVYTVRNSSFESEIPVTSIEFVRGQHRLDMDFDRIPVSDNPGGGDCFFWSVLMQLGGEETPTAVQKVREDVVDMAKWISSNSQHARSDFEGMRRQGTWADDDSIATLFQATALLYNRPLVTWRDVRLTKNNAMLTRGEIVEVERIGVLQVPQVTVHYAAHSYQKEYDINRDIPFIPGYFIEKNAIIVKNSGRVHYLACPITRP